MSTTKNTTAQSDAVKDAQDHVTDLEATIASLEAELETMRSELATLRDVYSSGKPMDIDRMMDIEESLIPRREERLEVLARQALPDAEKAVKREELYALAEAGADGIEGRYKAHQEVLESAERRIAKALAEVRASAEEWNAFVVPVGDAAKAAGLSTNAAVDHPVKYISPGLYASRAPVVVRFNGEDYRPVNADKAVRDVVSTADATTASLLREASDARIVSEGQRIARVDRGNW